MKSGISISKINEMINEGLASAGGNDWELIAHNSGNTSSSGFTKELKNFKEIFVYYTLSGYRYATNVVIKNHIFNENVYICQYAGGGFLLTNTNITFSQSNIQNLYVYAR